MKLLRTDEREACPPNNWTSRSNVQSIVLITTTALGIYLCYLMAAPFMPALAFALALAVLFTPLQRRLESALRRASLAAAVAVLVIGLIVAVPATFVGRLLMEQAAEGVELVQSKVQSGEWRRVLETQPRLARIANKIERQIDLTGSIKSIATWLSSAGGFLLKGSLYQVIGFCLTFYLLFFFLRDRRVALRTLRSMSPLSTGEMNRLFRRVADTIHATVYGLLMVSFVQGVLGALMFWWLGLSAPLLWGVVMALVAVVPVLGAFVVWVPAAIYLALDGSWSKALILVMWGVLVIGTIDNLLRPILVGKRLDLHTVPAFISVVGGLMLFGPAGLILGPVALTVTAVLLDTWRRRAINEASSRSSMSS
jgi:predicted PurR-regulated permease PerM